MPTAINNGVGIYYQVEGNGLPLVLHIGGLGRLEAWYQTGFVDALKDDYTLILLDPRGQGRSDKPHDPGDYSLSARVDDVISVLDDIGVQKAHFLGNSMGGHIGFAIGVYRPDRFNSLIIGGTHPYEPFSMSDEEIALLRRGMPAFVEAWEQEHGPAPPAAREHWLENDGQAFAAYLLASRQYPNLGEHLHSITLPTLIYCGSEDEVLAKAKQAAEAMPHASFVGLEGFDHLTVLRNGATVLVPHIRAFVEDALVSA
jgi:pimeloyl-ACP methyl ester carboxylesterase